MSATAAAAITSVVAHPSTLVERPFTRSPITRGLLAISISTTSSGGAGQWAQRLGGRRRGADVGLAGLVERRRGGQDDEVHHQVREEHPDAGIPGGVA